MAHLRVGHIAAWGLMVPALGREGRVGKAGHAQEVAELVLTSVRRPTWKVHQTMRPNPIETMGVSSPHGPRCPRSGPA